MVVAGRPEGEEKHGLVVLLGAAAMADGVLGRRSRGGVIRVRLHGSVAVHGSLDLALSIDVHLWI